MYDKKVKFNRKKKVQKTNHLILGSKEHILTCKRETVEIKRGGNFILQWMRRRSEVGVEMGFWSVEENFDKRWQKFRNGVKDEKEVGNCLRKKKNTRGVVINTTNGENDTRN